MLEGGSSASGEEGVTDTQGAQLGGLQGTSAQLLSWLMRLIWSSVPDCGQDRSVEGGNAVHRCWSSALLICVKDRSAGVARADHNWVLDVCPELGAMLGQRAWPGISRALAHGPRWRCSERGRKGEKEAWGRKENQQGRPCCHPIPAGKIANFLKFSCLM